MTTRNIYSLVAAMSIALLGLIGVQLYWIDTAINVKEERFAQNVTDALGILIHTLEVQESASAVSEELSPKESYKNIPAIPPPIKPKNKRPTLQVPPQIVAKPPNSPQIQRINYPLPDQQSAKSFVEITSRAQSQPSKYSRFFTQINQTEKDINYSQTPIENFGWNTTLFDQQFSENLQAINNYNKSVFKQDSLMKIKVKNLHAQVEGSHKLFTFGVGNNAISFQSQNGKVSFTNSQGCTTKSEAKDSLMHNVNLQKNNIVQSVILHLEQNEPEIWMNVNQQPDNFEEPTSRDAATPRKYKYHRYSNSNEQAIKVSRKVEQFSDVAVKLVCELSDIKTLQQRVQPCTLDSLLQQNLRNKGILLNCEYAILLEKNDSVLLSNTPTVRSETKTSTYTATMFPNDILPKHYSLRVFFPDQKSFILQSLWALMASSGIFLSIIIGTFGFTVIALVRQKKLTDLKTDFINNMTHEFQTPIATISLASEALKDETIVKNEERRTRFVNVIFDENKRLGKQVELILQAASLEKGKFTISKQEIDIHQVILSAVHHSSMQVEKKGGNIFCNLDAQRPHIVADEAHISNILHNLLDNANKYSPIEPIITVSTYNTKEGIYISIEDNGIGMNREHQKRVFERFYRVPTGNRHDVKGFGLGLSYVKSMVEAHCGRVSVQSELGNGSKFQIFLPYQCFTS